MTISPEEIRRLNSWAGVIAQSLRPEAPVARTADGLRIGRKGSLSITADATWYDHETGKGGHDALSLIRHLRGCSSEAAIFWARGWLEQHLGDGDLHVEVDAEAVAEASARRTAWALQVLDDATDPFGTPAEAGELAARDSALRWKREGRRVRIARPPRGLDFNDLLVAPAFRARRRSAAARQFDELTAVRDLLREICELMDSLSEIQLPVSVKEFQETAELLREVSELQETS